MIPLPRPVKAKLKSTLLKRWGLEPPCPFDDMQRLLNGVTGVVDGGACVGRTAARFREIFPDASIWCFEPVPANLERLRQRDIPRMEVIPAALAESSGPRTIHISTTPGGHSLLGQAEGSENHIESDARHIETCDIEALALDDWVRERNITVDVLKLDTQGGELLALQGANETLKTCRAVLSELHFLPLYADAPVADELWSFLRIRGFRLYRFYDTWCDRQGQLIQGDGLFLRV